MKARTPHHKANQGDDRNRTGGPFRPSKQPWADPLETNILLNMPHCPVCGEVFEGDHECEEADA